MAETNVTGGTCRELTKYRMTFAAALAALALAGWMFQTAYEQHIKVLQIGDDTGQALAHDCGLAEDPRWRCSRGGRHSQSRRSHQPAPARLFADS